MRNDLLAEHLGVTPNTVADLLEQTGSLIKTIESLRTTGRTLTPYKVPALSGIEEWLADNEILDPHGPDEIFEMPGRKSLFNGWATLRRKHHRQG